MEYLLDTHTFLWSLFDSKELPNKIKEIIRNDNNDIFLSTASLWEIEIKHLKKPNLMPYSAKDIFGVISAKTNYILLDVRAEYLFGLSEIHDNELHKDPFDQLLISMAADEKMTLITHDSIIEKYQLCKTIVY